MTVTGWRISSGSWTPPHGTVSQGGKKESLVYGTLLRASKPRPFKFLQLMLLSQATQQLAVTQSAPFVFIIFKRFPVSRKEKRLFGLTLPHLVIITKFHQKFHQKFQVFHFKSNFTKNFNYHQKFQVFLTL